MESVWYYSYRHFGEEQADRYINQISNIFQALSENNIGTHRPELGEYISALPVERHMIYFLKTDNDIIVIRVLNQHQDAGPSSQLELTRDNHIVLRENWQGYRGVPGQNSRSAPLLLSSSSFCHDPGCTGITPFLPKAFSPCHAWLCAESGPKKDPFAGLGLSAIMWVKQTK